MDEQEKRVRAWVLIKSDNPEDIVDRIWALDKKDGSIVVIRTDIIKEGSYSLVVPFDMASASLGMVTEFFDGLKENKNVNDFEFAVVKCFIPDPAQDSSGYITGGEFKRGEKQAGVRAGRQDNSPGFNPWG